MQDMAHFDIDQVIVAGDSVNWGPFSRQVLEIITARGWAIVRGNNELYALDYCTERAPQHWSTFTMPPYLHDALGDDGVKILACMPDTLQLRFRDAPPLRVFHGIPGDPWIAMYPDSSEEQVCEWLAGIAERTVIAAHSHVAMERHVAGWHIFNPGSVGVPLDGEHSASYMILEGGSQGWELAAHRRLSPLTWRRFSPNSNGKIFPPAPASPVSWSSRSSATLACIWRPTSSGNRALIPAETTASIL